MKRCCGTSVGVLVTDDAERLGLARLGDYVRAHVASTERLSSNDYEAWARAPRGPRPQHLWHHPDD